MSDILKPETGNLHRVMDSIEQIKDTVTREREDHSQGVAALKAQNDSLIEIVEGLEKRCNALDEALPSGEKVFRSEVAGPVSRDQALKAFGEVMTASRAVARGELPSKAFQRIQGEVTSTEGGVLVPTETYDGVMQLIFEKSIIRQIANVIPMTRDQMVVPTRASGPSVEWITEGGGGAITDQSVVFESDANSLLTTQTLTVLDKVSRELDEDSLVALEPFLADVFSQAIGAEENRVAFNGNAALAGDPFNGVSMATGITEVHSGATILVNITYAKLLELKYLVDAETNGADAAWIFHPTVFQHVAGLKDDQNRPLFLQQYGAGGTMNPDANAGKGVAGFLMGTPVYFSSQLPTAAAAATGGATAALKLMAIYGAFKTGFAFGDRRNLTVETNDSVFFNQRARALLASERVAMRVAVPKAFGIIRKT